MELENKKILFIEDDSFIGEMLEKRLTVAGALCTWATSGEKALNILQTETFDLIISDLMMAGLNGYEVVKQIKENEVTKNIPVVVWSNRTSLNEDTKRINELELDGFFIKSDISLQDFVSKVAEIVNQDKH